MSRNYFITALRNLAKGRLFTFINMVCLAMGMAAFLLIWLYTRDEMGYDRGHSKSDRIFRAVQVIQEEGGGEESSSVPFPMRRLLLEEFPGEIGQVVRLFNYQSPYASVQYGYIRHIENKFFFTDSSFFEVFDFPLLRGDKSKVLRIPNSVVISERAAKKYFGDADPIGKVLRFEDRTDLRVQGVAGSIPGGSHIEFDFLISMEAIGPVVEKLEQNYIWNPAWTYILLKEGVKPEAITKRLPLIAEEYIEPELKDQCEFLLQPLRDIHLRSHLDYEMGPNNYISNVYIFSGIALFILLIACINFMNLSTARSAARVREVAIRKVAGATRRQLILQFLTESVLLAMLSVLPALALVELLIPVFNQLSEQSLSLSFSETAGIVLLIPALALLVGIISGIYPALFLSSFEPMRVLKDVRQPGKRSIFFRKALVVFQFTLSIVLIISTLMARSQLNYLRNAGLGFDHKNLLLIPTDRTDAWMKIDSLRNDFAQHPGFVSLTAMGYMIGVQTNTHNFLPEGKEPGSYSYFPGLKVNRDFVRTMGMQLVAGRDFSADPGDDTLAVIINESMVRRMKWKDAQDALGRSFATHKGREKVIGVVKDFHFMPLSEEIGPFVLDLPNDESLRAFFTKYLVVKINPEYESGFLTHLQKAWERRIPSRPFDSVFLSEAVADQYNPEEKIGMLIGYFSGLAILIACLSLFGLSSFSTQQRTREIGIRKVLGATAAQIVKLLLADVARLIIIATLLAVPVAWACGSLWLESFAYHTGIPLGAFGIAAVLSMGIALLTTGYHAIRAATANPVDSIR